MLVSLVTFAPYRDTFVGFWRKSDKRPEKCLLIAERGNRQWNLYRRGDRVVYKERPAVIVQEHYHSAPEYFYEIQKEDGGETQLGRGGVAGMAPRINATL